MFIDVVTTTGQLYTGEARSVNVPGADGPFEILPKHAPIVSTMVKGRIKITDMAGDTHYFEVEGGIVEANNDKIVILADN